MRTRRSPKNQNKLFRALGVPSKADFALMQTAPALLAVAKRARAELCAMHSHFYPSCDGGCPADDITMALAEVIARAEGRKP